MELLPILRALNRNTTGAALIGFQIALTLAIICNCLSVIQQRVQEIERPTGIDEANIFTLTNAWVVAPDDLKARIEGDLAVLRSLPGVIDAEATNSYPLRGGGRSQGLSVKADQRLPSANTTIYYVDPQGSETYGVRLVEGRWFTSDEMSDVLPNDVKFPATIVVTRTLARVLFPVGRALGQTVYFTGNAPSRIVGVVEEAQTPWAALSAEQALSENSTFVPFQFLNNGIYYVVRTKPGQQAAVMRAAPAALYDLTRQRVISAVRSFTETRRQAYLVERATAVELSVLSALLLAVTASGVIGLTMYWVLQRRRQIGMRRALGARRVDILNYFHTENLLIAGIGCAFGITAGLAGNAWLASNLELARMSTNYILFGALIVLALSQAAVLWPALRASAISPAIATRGL